MSVLMGGAWTGRFFPLFSFLFPGSERGGGLTADWLPLLSSYSTQQLWFVPLKLTGKRRTGCTHYSLSSVTPLYREWCVHGSGKRGGRRRGHFIGLRCALESPALCLLCWLDRVCTALVTYERRAPCLSPRRPARACLFWHVCVCCSRLEVYRTQRKLRFVPLPAMRVLSTRASKSRCSFCRWRWTFPGEIEKRKPLQTLTLSIKLYQLALLYFPWVPWNVLSLNFRLSGSLVWLPTFFFLTENVLLITQFLYWAHCDGTKS